MPSMQPPTTADGAPIDDPQPRPAARRFILILSGLLFAVGTLGSNLGPAWIDERPAVVLAMSSRNRNLLASVPFIDPLPFTLIGFSRVLLAGVALFFLGRWYGAKAIQWTEGQVGELPAIYSWFQRAVDKAGWLMVILMPGSNLVCMMAGYRRMKPAAFLLCISIGIAGKLAVLWAGGKAFEDEIRSFLDAIDGYQWYIVGGLFAITFIQSMVKAKRNLPDIMNQLEHPRGGIGDPPSSSSTSGSTVESPADQRAAHHDPS
jgi:membrane protein DedA with SNARE-associated domain